MSVSKPAEEKVLQSEVLGIVPEFKSRGMKSIWQRAEELFAEREKKEEKKIHLLREEEGSIRGQGDLSGSPAEQEIFRREKEAKLMGIQSEIGRARKDFFRLKEEAKRKLLRADQGRWSREVLSFPLVATSVGKFSTGQDRRILSGTLAREVRVGPEGPTLSLVIYPDPGQGKWEVVTICYREDGLGCPYSKSLKGKTPNITWFTSSVDQMTTQELKAYVAFIKKK